MPELTISLVEELKAADVFGGSFSRRKQMSEDHKLESQKDKFCVDCTYCNLQSKDNNENNQRCMNTFNLVTGKPGVDYCAWERDQGDCGKEGKNFKRK